MSQAGRGVFDGRSGRQLARDRVDAAPFVDEITLTARGIGPLDEQRVRIAGVYGGGLPTGTRDGWHVQAVPTPWPDYAVVLEAPGTSLWQDAEQVVKVALLDVCELRAYDFSELGTSFVVASSCDITLCGR